MQNREHYGSAKKDKLVQEAKKEIIRLQICITSKKILEIKTKV